MINDPFSAAANSLIAPSADCFPIVPDDTQEFGKATKAIFVGTGGDIVLQAIGSEDFVTFRNVIAGSILDIRIRAIRSTGTTAQDIVGLA
jgi:hypothetical protein